eukprot:TRINITY_DN17139_c0_g1_i1.p1 TRINITY_DN17139_c0_g1~~TRINITY_DN17139_c0_g1_i1.p1  ORF type:complete len:63 (-),score=2.06 TRINITY_DN17139_c0_g1_i1:72-260(-)
MLQPKNGVILIYIELRLTEKTQPKVKKQKLQKKTTRNTKLEPQKTKLETKTNNLQPQTILLL